MNAKTEQLNDEPLQARMAVAAPSSEGQLKTGDVIEFMAMPAGTHTCWFGQGAKGVQRTVTVEREAAARLGEQLQAVNARGKQRAFFDFDHEDKAASAWPLGFAWKDGPEPGVYCRAELSKAGAEAISGKNLQIVAEECEALLKIQDDRVFTQRAIALGDKIDSLKQDILHLPKAAQALAEVSIAALFNGLTEKQARKQTKQTEKA